MGRCHEFGLQISEGCNHEMLAGENECTCAGCGVACGGQFAGCPDVWARGQPAVMQTEVVIGRTATLQRVSAGAGPNGPGATGNGPGSPANGIASTWAPEPPLPPDTPWQPEPTAAPSAEEAPATPATHPEHAEPAPTEARPPSPYAPDVSSELRAVADGLKLQQSMLGDLLSGLTRQQAMMAELLDARHAELRLAMVAESLPDSVAEAVTKSFAANQEQLTEAAVALAKSIGMDAAVSKALKQVASRADDRFDELCERQEKLVAKAMRAGARQPAAKAAPKRATPAKKVTAAKKATAAKKRQPAKKAVRTSSQGTRPSRRSLGS